MELNIATTAPYSPRPIKVMVTNLPKALMENEPLAKALVNVIENIAEEITGFQSFTGTRAALEHGCEGPNDFTIHLAKPGVGSSVTVYTRELDERAISRMLSQVIREHVVGKTIVQLATDPFSLVAYEYNRTETHLVAAWSIPSFFIDNTLRISSKVDRTPMEAVDSGDGIDHNIYSFDLIGACDYGDHLFDSVSEAIEKGSLFSKGYSEELKPVPMGEEKTFTDASIKAFEPGQD